MRFGCATKMSESNIADSICDHVGCYNVSEWLSDLAKKLGVAPEDLMPSPPQHDYQFILPQRGLQLRLRHPHAGHVDNGDPDRLILTEVQFSTNSHGMSSWSGQLPFGLDAAIETPASAELKLGVDINREPNARFVSNDDMRRSYHLDDGRVVGIAWKSGFAGIDAVVVVRLGREIDYRELFSERPSST